MSIFPMKILLATDGSEVATLAATTPASLATRTGSELHVLIVGPEYPYYELPDYPARFEEVVGATIAMRSLPSSFEFIEGHRKSRHKGWQGGHPRKTKGARCVG